jgi:hypothetical protein
MKPFLIVMITQPLRPFTVVPDLKQEGFRNFGYGPINQLVLMTFARVNDVPPQRGRLGEL